MSVMSRLLPRRRVTVADDPTPGGVVGAARNLVATTEGTWAWFRLMPQEWSWSSPQQRASLLGSITLRWADLAGHRVQLRQSSQPFPYEKWARDWDKRTAGKRLPDREGAMSFTQRSRATQARLRDTGAQDPFVYLGVRLTTRTATPDDLRAVIAGRGTSPLALDALKALQKVERNVARNGFEAKPLTARGLAWLLHASQALGVPVDPVSIDRPSGDWAGADLDTFTAPVHVFEDEAYSPHAQVRAFRRGRAVDRYVTVLTAGALPEIDTDSPSMVPWMAYTNGLNAQVEWSAILDIVPGKLLQADATHGRQVAEDQAEHYREHDQKAPLRVEQAIQDAHRREDEVHSLEATIATRAIGQLRCAVISNNPDDLPALVNEVTASLNDRVRLNMHHTPNQVGLVEEFRLGSGRARGAGHERQMPVYYLSAAVPHASSSIGDGTGSYFGQVVEGGRGAAMHDPNWFTQHGKSGLALTIATLRHGKSAVFGSEVYDAVLDGKQAIVLDPSGPLARLCTVPAIAPDSVHVELMSSRAGTLVPYRMVPNPVRSMFPSDDDYDNAVLDARSERRQLMVDTLMALLPSTTRNRDGADSAVEDAVALVADDYNANPWWVIQKLEQEGSAATRVAQSLRTIAGNRGVRLIFPTEEHEPTSPQLDVSTARLTVITMRGISVPTGDPRNGSERIAVPLLDLAARYAARAMYADQSPKVIKIDEAGILAQRGASFGPVLVRGARDSGKSNTDFDIASQNPGDFIKIDPEIGNLAGRIRVGRLPSTASAQEALRIMELDPMSGRHTTIQHLDRGQWLTRDHRNRHAVVQHDMEPLHVNEDGVTVGFRDPALWEALQTDPGNDDAAESEAHYYDLARS